MEGLIPCFYTFQIPYSDNRDMTVQIKEPQKCYGTQNVI